MKAGRAPGTAALVAAALLAAAGMAGAVGRSAFLGDYLRQSRIVYPQQVGEWASRGEHRYETAALGVSVRYENPRLPGARLDLYAFPGGALLEPAFAEAVTRTVQELETVARTRDPDLFEPGDMRAFAVDDPVAAYLGEHTPRPRSYALQAGVDGHVEQSAMAIALREMYFVKVRLSLPGDASRREQVRTLAEDFLRAALVRLRIVNTGACFHPLQVVALPVDRVRPDDILASAGEGTPQEVVDEMRAIVESRSGSATRASMSRSRPWPIRRRWLPQRRSARRCTMRCADAASRPRTWTSRCPKACAKSAWSTGPQAAATWRAPRPGRGISARCRRAPRPPAPRHVPDPCPAPCRGRG